jgi:hypothetical protein
MCGEDDDRAFRDLIDRLYSDCALGFKIGDDMRVVDDFVLHVDRFSVTLERDLDYVHCAYDSGAKTSWSGQKYLQIISSMANYSVPGSDI